MSELASTSVKLPETINQQLLLAIISDGYGMRGKSKWVVEAIESFLTMPDYWELVEIADDMDGHSAVLSLRIPVSVADDLEKAVVAVRQQCPALEGVKSKVIRASILQRLIRSSVAV